MVPSVTSAVYFLVFVGVLLTWALYIRVEPKRYSILKHCLFVYNVVHMVLLYLCQLSYIQEYLDNYMTFYSRCFTGSMPLPSKLHNIYFLQNFYFVLLGCSE